MITSVDEALRSIVKADALGGTSIDVVFDAPTKDWAARRNAPTVNLYLYDLREDMRRREKGFIEDRSPDGTVIARRPSPRYFKLSYLVTAWTSRPEDEHRLLDSLLRAFLKYDAMPPELVTGALDVQGEPVPLTIGLPPPQDRAFADVWSALGGELKPSLDLVVSAPVDTGVVFKAGPPVGEALVIDIQDTTSAGTEERRRKHVAIEFDAAKARRRQRRGARDAD